AIAVAFLYRSDLSLSSLPPTTMHSPLSFAPTTAAIYPSGASSLLLAISLFPFSCSEHHCLHEASSLYHNDLSLPSLSQCYSFPIAVVLFLSCEDKPKRYLLVSLPPIASIFPC
ncbi:hypothetical protein BHE74_00054280, partial [Ensete ventricosum]